MNLNNLQLQAIRDRLHNLDLNKDSDKKRFFNLAQFYITDAERRRHSAYDDHTGEILVPGKKPQGKVTIGVGFNMSADKARDEWEEVFKGNVDFDEAFVGRLRLTHDQIDMLFRKTFQDRIKEVKRVYIVI